MISFKFGENKSRYTHNLDYQINTTCDFGSVQPLLCRKMMARDKVRVKMPQLLRLAPMPSPTFADVKSVSSAVFVPMSEIFPNFESLLGNNSVRGSVPTHEPIVSSRLLWLHLMWNYCYMDVALINATQNFLDNVDDQLGIMQWLYNVISLEYVTGVDYEHFVASMGDFVHKPLRALGQSSTAWNTSIYDYSQRVVVDNTHQYAVGFRLTETGRRLMKIFRGLGYGMNFLNNNSVSALPLLAFYKAWFDRYGITRKINFTDTKCFQLIYDIDNYPGGNGGLETRYLAEFLDEMLDCTINDSLDFYTAHTEEPISYIPTVDPPANDIHPQPGGPLTLSSSVRNTGQEIPSIATSPYEITDITLRTLSRLTKYITADSLIGRKVSDWVRLHYGEKMVENLFGISHVIGDYVVQANIDDVMSTSDTTNAAGTQGNYLGAYAGRGIGFSQGQFEYDSAVPGYLIVFQGLKVRVGHCCVDNPSLYGITRYTEPTAEFDGLGYELTPQACVVPSLDLYRYVDNQDNLTGQSFGYIPRMSMHKYQPDILNGDMANRSSHTAFDSYHDEFVPLKMDTIAHPYFRFAGDFFRHPWMYPEFCNYDRMFYNSDAFQNSSLPSSIFASNVYLGYDNFILQSKVDFKHTNELKPIGESYMTQEAEDNNFRTGEVK